MLQSIFLKTVRDYRRQILIWGGGIGLLMLAYGSGYNSIFGEGPGRAKAIEDYRKTVEAFSMLTGKIYDIDTFGGFINTKIGSVMPVLLGIWAVLAGSAITRGEEERGSLDLLMTTPHSRSSVIWQKWAGVMTSMLGICVLSWIGLTLAAVVSQSPDLTPLDAALAHLNWALVSLFFGALALLISQMTSRKAAIGWAGGLLAATYLLNNVTESVDSLQWTQYVYPFYYANLSQPLAHSVGTNWVGIAILAIGLVPLVGLAMAAFERRDLNGYFDLFKREKPITVHSLRNQIEPTSPWLSNNFTFGLRAALPGILIWGLSISVYTLLIMSAFNDIKSSMSDFLSSNNFFVQLGFANFSSNENILSLFIFVFLVLLVAAYAVGQVASWTAEENEGRLELLLSTPKARWRVLLDYFAVAVVSSALMIAIIGVIFGLCAWIFNISVNAGNTLGAFAGLWIVCVIIEAVGYILAAFGPGWAVSVTAGLVVLSYVSDLLQDVFKLPDALVNLSVFHQYGHPIADGLKWTPQLLMLLVSVVFIGIAVFRFRQRDITK